jgi:hypothetical protein
MKIKLITCVIIASLITFSNTVEANKDIQKAKQLSVGVGTYALVIDHDNSGEDEFLGHSLSVTYAFSDNMSMNIQTYALEHDDHSNVEIEGFDMSVFYGTGLVSKGFKSYIGIGLYSETLQFENTEKDLSGVQLSGGVGYSWNKISFGFLIGIRSTEDYEDLANDGSDITAISSSLVLEYKF